MSVVFNRRSGMWCIYTAEGTLVPNYRFTTRGGAIKALNRLSK